MDLLLTQVTTNIEPPVADKDQLAELGAVGAEETGLPAINVTVMPTLTSGLGISVETRVGLFVTVEVCVGYRTQHGIVSAWSA